MYYFIVNPDANGGQSGNKWKKLERQLGHLGIEYEAFDRKTRRCKKICC